MELKQNTGQDLAPEPETTAFNGLPTTLNQTSATPQAVHPEACSSCENEATQPGKAGGGATYIYALGQIATRFPSQGIEQEFNQAVSRADTKGKTDAQIFQEVLSLPENAYLARHLCWVFTIEGIDTYILQPLGINGYEQLIQAIRPIGEGRDDIDIILGVKGRIASPDMCGGLTIPIVGFDQVYSFDREAFIEAIPATEGLSKKENEQFRQSASELFHRIEQMADNAGATNEHRALNYLVARYPNLYAQTAKMQQNDFSLSRINTLTSRLSGVRSIVDVIFSYAHRKTDVTEKYFVRVDVTEKFPFIHSKLAQYYDR